MSQLVDSKKSVQRKLLNTNNDNSLRAQIWLIKQVKWHFTTKPDTFHLAESQKKANNMIAENSLAFCGSSCVCMHVSEKF